MKTKQMIALLTDAGYSLKLLSTQSKVSYMKLFRYVRRDGSLTPDEKAKLWRFGIAQPIVSDALENDIQEAAE